MAFSALDWFFGGDDPLTSTRGSFLSGLDNSFTGNLDYNRQKELQQMSQVYSALEAQKNRDFQERLSKTSYQRAVADLKGGRLKPCSCLQSRRLVYAVRLCRLFWHCFR